LILWMGLALAGSWEGADPNVEYVGTVAADESVILDALMDWQVVSSLFPEECALNWAIGVPESGPGARARVTWTPSWMYRRLTVEVTTGPHHVDHDFLGSKGFSTRFAVEPAESGSKVTVTGYIAAPKWPARDIYYQKVKPAWANCYASALDALNSHLETKKAEAIGGSGQGSDVTELQHQEK